jgi:hypothetical protein
LQLAAILAVGKGHLARGRGGRLTVCPADVQAQVTVVNLFGGADARFEAVLLDGSMMNWANFSN